MKDEKCNKVLPERSSAPYRTGTDQHDCKQENGKSDGVFPFETDAEKFRNCHSSTDRCSCRYPLADACFAAVRNAHGASNISSPIDHFLRSGKTNRFENSTTKDLNPENVTYTDKFMASSARRTVSTFDSLLAEWGISAILSAEF